MGKQSDRLCDGTLPIIDIHIILHGTMTRYLNGNLGIFLPTRYQFIWHIHGGSNNHVATMYSPKLVPSLSDGRVGNIGASWRRGTEDCDYQDSHVISIEMLVP